MRRKRRNHLPGFKAKMVLAAIKGDKPLAELANHFDLHQNQIAEWKKQLLDQVESVFGRAQDHQLTTEAKRKDLHAKIGQLTLENDFLSKALGR